MSVTASTVNDRVAAWVGEPSKAELEGWLHAQPSLAEETALLEHREHVGKEAFRLHPLVSRRFGKTEPRRLDLPS